VTNTDRYGHWNIDAVGEFDPEDWVGFIYEIEHLPTGRLYIGRKMFRAKRKKTKSNSSRTKSSDWQTYTSSSETVTGMIKDEGKDQFAFRIILLCIGKCMLNYEEESIQRACDVLRARLPDGSRKYFNNTIGYKNFGGLEKQTEETKRKIAAALTGRVRGPQSEETKQKISATMTGRVQTPEHIEAAQAARTEYRHTDEAKAKISRAHKGRQLSPEWRAKLSAAKTKESHARDPETRSDAVASPSREDDER
jgi:Putative endonuclease segE, GIY-YIG domain/NUMOD3 motif